MTQVNKYIEKLESLIQMLKLKGIDATRCKRPIVKKVHNM